LCNQGCQCLLIAKGKGKFLAQSAIEAIEMAYERGETDEFVQSSVIKSPTKMSFLYSVKQINCVGTKLPREKPWKFSSVNA
jgi:bisphosphoglycerate-independent phosphoglycerate mutase (AlkP superfamily)